ncbi:MAG: trypsin-like peptidase domain-containing protein [Deltaproteobacteria bacterium]|nr:trypsin-like peptidase domain-containing protein [Deltaproteobacteria bacterium]
MRARSSFARVAPLIAVLSCLLAHAGGAHAQELSERATERCVRSAVRIQVDITGPGGRTGSSTGSGAVIDPRGYILTNFHVVGQTRWSSMGLPGAFLGDGQHIQIATVESARMAAQPRWIARVVRADVRLDLAILRIVSQADGSPIPPGTTFETIEIASTEGMQPGAPLWAFGFPLGVRTINVTGGHTTGFQMNARNEVAWIRTDAEFNPGNSGGMLVDRRGRLVAVPTAVVSGDETLEPIELARPAERIPQAWLDALSRGSIDDVLVTGITPLVSGGAATASAVGDSGGLDDEPEIQFFSLPASRPATVRATPAVPIALVSASGIVREARGQISITQYDPPNTMLAVLLPRPTDGSATEARLSFDDAAPAVATAPGIGPGSAPGGYAGAPGGAYAGAPGGGYGGAPGTASGGAYAGGGYAASVSARGTVVDGRTGRPVSAFVLVARPGVDPAQAANLFVSGQILPQQLESMLLTRAEAGPTGAFELRGLMAGTFSTLVVARGYRPTLVQITIPAGAPQLTLSPLTVFQ